MESKTFTIITKEFNPERITETEEVLEGDEINEPRFILTFYVNNQVTSTVDSVRASMAYDMGVLSNEEAMEQSPENRWHILVRSEAIQKMLELQDSELTLAFQTPLDGYDTEHVTVKCKSKCELKG